MSSLSQKFFAAFAKVLRILRRLQLGSLEPWLHAEKREWEHKLAATDKAAIHLARALVMNPEVLVLNRPTIYFDDETQGEIFGLIKEHVDTLFEYFEKNYKTDTQ